MRLSNLEDAWIRADAQYFLDEGFISQDIYQRVLKWLEGEEDSESQAIVASWMEKDAEWMKSVESGAMARFWYFAPVIKLGSGAMRNILVSRAKQLKGIGDGPEEGLGQLIPMSPLDGPPLPRLFNIKWPE
ncbi:MAG: hypothetical protein Q8K55_11475 [Gemmatimonadaceae bacterium]|nr:hypothetical protein [Gemmatimonadaceae bacterium]